LKLPEKKEIETFVLKFTLSELYRLFQGKKAVEPFCLGLFSLKIFDVRTPRLLVPVFASPVMKTNFDLIDATQGLFRWCTIPLMKVQSKMAICATGKYD
jgi:hypothetical protein